MRTILSPIDLSIIILYLGVLIFIGFYLKRRASRNLESYLLGGKSIPWYMLGLSNASGMFDISGTVWLVAITVVYGLKSIYIPWLWPVFNQIFLMVYLSAWLRRSGCTTGAEWAASLPKFLNLLVTSNVFIAVVCGIVLNLLLNVLLKEKKEEHV